MPKGLNWCSNAPKVISRSGSSRDTPTPCPLPWMLSLSSREAVLLELGSSYPPAALWRRSHWTPAWPLLPPSRQKLWAPKADLIYCGGGSRTLGEIDRGARSIQSSEKKSRQTLRKLQHGGENGSELLFMRLTPRKLQLTTGRTDGRTDASLTSQKTHWSHGLQVIGWFRSEWSAAVYQIGKWNGAHLNAGLVRSPIYTPELSLDRWTKASCSLASQKVLSLVVANSRRKKLSIVFPLKIPAKNSSFCES